MPVDGTVSCIVNTISLHPKAGGANSPYRESSYAARAKIVKERIIPRMVQGKFHEIVVAGVFEKPPEDTPDYRYVFCGPYYGDRRDALMQREVGARLSTGDILLFTHDDHLPDFDAADIPDGEWDILVPKRVHGITGEELDNGRQRGYMGGHSLLMRREVWVAIPWIRVAPYRCWDIPMTRIWKEHDFEIVWTDDLTSIDLEAKAHEQ